MLIAVARGTTIQLDAPASGLADPIVNFRYQRELGAAWKVTAEGAIKPALADDDNGFLSSGATDYGLQLAASRRYTKHAFSGGLSQRFFGDPSDGNTSLAEEASRLYLTWEGACYKKLMLVVSAVTDSGLLEDARDSELTGARFRQVIGLRWSRPGRSFNVAISENLGGDRTAPDIGFHFGASYHY